MTNLLFAWELGANYGHLSRDLRVAECLRERGHSVVFAVRDTRTATELLTPRSFEFVQAPLPQTPTRLERPPANYAELLLAEGWGDRFSLHGRIRAWLALFTLARIDTLIADHSPTALLAAHIAGLNCVAFGNGFEIPPQNTPMPSIRPWESIPSSRLEQSEELVLGQMNAASRALGGKLLERFGDIFPERQVLVTFAELDHYGARRNATYTGSIHGIECAEKVAWSNCGRAKIVAYLRLDQKTTDAVLAAIAEAGGEAICVVPGIRPEQTQKYASPKLTIYSRPVDLESLLACADIFICSGGGSIAQSLLAGVPMVLIPTVVEQYLAARAVENLGACVLLGKARGKDAVLAAIKKMLSDDTFRQAAQRFANKYRGSTPERSAGLAADAILNTASCLPLHGQGSASIQPMGGQDINQVGISQAAELKTMSETGIRRTERQVA